ncbi:choice-of-anchor B family protein [Salsipaludibacter albus]|uniref:choice-of-anchor B family protein n=1 Tax=Salsipaludibacter albus TaxID=2849650 RepID=UPI001EE4446D|nr:choice-of-anchor B family protein [Salsipaludibacter albus]MBY5162792.1 choice-of-anchor B family protein [Salsipaludibacter albus]
MTHPLRRPIGLAVVLALALMLVVANPRAAQAHDSCVIAPPTSMLVKVVAAVNVFSSLLSTEAPDCPDKFAEVEPILERDFVVDNTTSPADRADPDSQAPTFAPCVRGMAADLFPCDGIDMLAYVSHAELGTTRANDIWGWTDPATRKDYALVGATNGTVFVDITQARRPVVLGILPTASTVGGSTWRDIKVYEDHAFVVSEHTDHGVQVFDLTRLRDWDGTYTEYDMDAHYIGHGSAHNININTDTGFAYSVGAGPHSAQGLPNLVTIDAPSATAGSYQANDAAFGPAASEAGLSGSVVLTDDATGATADACQPLVGFPAGAIAIADRGSCNFTIKAANAQAAGAVALIVANNAPGGGTISMGGSDPSITIPAVMVSLEDGAVIKAGLPATGSVSTNPDAPSCGTGLHMIDINDPVDPQFGGCFDGNGYVHDTQCVVYDGPDADFQGHEICFNSNGLAYSTNPAANLFSIVDVTDKDNPETLSVLGYSGSGYSHQGWLTEDQAWFMHGDEGDEQLNGLNTTTRVWDVSDLRNPVHTDTYTNATTSIDHNLYTEGDLMYQSNYTTGLRITDVSDPASGLEEVAYFDVYPDNDNATFEGGTWSNYPYFRQKGVVAVSSIDRGLFILKPRIPGVE